MNFTSIVFLFGFFPLSIMGYFLLRLLTKKNTNWANWFSHLFLVLVSLCFYGWGRLANMVDISVYVVLVYALGHWIRSSVIRQRHKKLPLSIGIVIAAAALLYYKYYNFIVESSKELQKIGFELQDIIVPLGISFITFSAISYLVDVYRESAPAGKFLDVALYLTFFPKIVSGPIALWKDFHPQLQETTVNDQQFLYGLNRMIIGFSKKVILADTFGAVINEIQKQVGLGGIDSPTSWGCAFLFMLQIYYDFAGYSDIAIGISAMFGFKLKENFHFPYVSQSITEFWRRWHISLGAWFREYIYIPLGGNRKGFVRTLLNLGIVFLITGIWHGAGWNYLWWGLLNGAFVIIERCMRNRKFYQKIPAVLKWIFTMFLVLLGWQLFRFVQLEDFTEFIQIMFGAVTFPEIDFTFAYFFSYKIIVYMIIAVVGATVLQFSYFDKIKTWMNSTPVGLAVQECILFLLMIAAVITMVNSTYSPFIYFQY